MVHGLIILATVVSFMRRRIGNPKNLKPKNTPKVGSKKRKLCIDFLDSTQYNQGKGP